MMLFLFLILTLILQTLTLILMLPSVLSNFLLSVYVFTIYRPPDNNDDSS